MRASTLLLAMVAGVSMERAIVHGFSLPGLGGIEKVQVRERTGAGTKGARRNISSTRIYIKDKKTTDKNPSASTDQAGPLSTINPLTKATWYATEAFGKVFGGGKNAFKDSDINDPSRSAISFSLDQPPASLSETFQRIQQDNQRSYFLSGTVDKEIYDAQCIFADPFVSFAGRDRFVENLANLGSFITKYSARVIKEEAILDQAMVQTKVRRQK
jgi:hypothetical protein